MVNHGVHARECHDCQPRGNCHMSHVSTHRGQEPAAGSVIVLQCAVCRRLRSELVDGPVPVARPDGRLLARPDRHEPVKVCDPALADFVARLRSRRSTTRVG